MEQRVQDEIEFLCKAIQEHDGRPFDILVWKGIWKNVMKRNENSLSKFFLYCRSNWKTRYLTISAASFLDNGLIMKTNVFKTS